MEQHTHLQIAHSSTMQTHPRWTTARRSRTIRPMKKLILLRHAKSSWKHPGLSDHDRPLNKRGRAAAPVMAHWLRDQGHLPDAILCSSSKRTQETVERMRGAVPEIPEPLMIRDLYHAAPATIMRKLRTFDDPDADALMVVAHEPGTGALARQLAGSRADQIDAFPTAAAAVFLLDIVDWGDASSDRARLIAFAKPRELMGS